MKKKSSFFTTPIIGKITFLLLVCLSINIQLSAQEIAAQIVTNNRISYCPTEPCPCQGNYLEIQVYYFGEDNVSIEAYADLNRTILINSLVGVNAGDLLTINGAGLLGGTLAYKTYLDITNAADETCATKIHTSCPSLAWPGSTEDLKIVGKTFGDFTVFSRTDAESNFLCDISNVEQDWHVGGNIIGPANNTLGTQNNENLVFITFNNPRGTITNTGDFGINTLSPAAQLDIQGDAIVNETLDVNGITRINDNTPSSTPTEGALIVSGGVGIGQNLNVENNASVNNDFTVGNDAFIGRNLNVSVDASIINDLEVGNDATIGNDLAVTHNAMITNDLSIGRDAQVGQNLIVTDNANIGQTITAGANALVGNDLIVSNNANVTEDLAIGDDANIGDDLDVNGDAHVNGTVTIGTNNTPNSLGTVNTAQFQLFVNGGILTEEVLVRTGWADYVFEADYQKPSLEEVEKHINEHGHLHNTPSAEEVERNGLSLGDNAVLQQEKIEELYLHIIALNKRIIALEKGQ